MKVTRFLSLGTVVFVFASALEAQTAVNLSGTGYIDLAGSTALTPSSATGARFLWVPAKAALRFGIATSAINLASIGQTSFAAGNDAMASGADSIAIGSGAVACNSSSIALGYAAYSSGFHSLAACVSVADGDYSTAFGGGTALGPYSIAMGSVEVTSRRGVAVGIAN